MAVPIPRNPALIYHSLPALFRLLIVLAAYNYNAGEFMDRLAANSGAETGAARETFDFIVVGGGVAGSVVATRLAAADFSVLLLEAGGDPPNHSKVPFISSLLFGKVPEDWKYVTTPQKHSCFGLQGHSMHWPAGRGLGGSSMLNGMIYLRGKVQGFDAMANVTGDDIWRTENVLKYYENIENYYGHFTENDVDVLAHHAKKGPLTVSKSYLSPYITTMERAFHEFGYRTVDPNVHGPVQEGFSPMDLHINFGRRWSNFDGYIKPALRRQGATGATNLVVRRYSYVYKILFEEKAGSTVAVGVEYMRHGAVKRAHASKEVILSAGAIQTPKILMLSGIGPRQDLRALQIRPRVDLPVGQNLQDKYGTFIGPFLLPEGSGAAHLSELIQPSNYAKWLLTGVGPFASSNVEGSYSFKTSMAGGANSPPDIHTYVLTAPIDPFVNELLWTESFGVKKDLLRTLLQGPETKGRVAFWQLVNVAKPASVGRLSLNGSDPLNPPVINPNYFGDEGGEDLKTLVEGIKFAVRLVEESKAFKALGPVKLVPDVFPGCEGPEWRTDEYWVCVARQLTGSAYQYDGTAPIASGDPADGVSVVDSRLRVHGVKRLRVVDGSALQERYVSVKMGTCTVLGELASDFILEEYGKTKSSK